MSLYQTLAFAIRGKYFKRSYKGNKFKISAPTGNGEFELPNWSYSVSDIQVYFKNVFKKY